MSAERLDEVVAALRRPAAYPSGVDDVVRVLRTRVSVLFFAGAHVYKLKQPVASGLFDGSSVAARKRLCEEEVRLNRRASPRMYHGVLPVTRERDGSVVVDGVGEPLDWVVHMDRLPADRMLDTVLDRGEVLPGDLEGVARVLCDFHARARTGPSVNRHGLVPAVSRELVQNVDRLGRIASQGTSPLPRGGLPHLRVRLERFVQRNRALFERRVAEWRIREGHGDLHAGNVCLAGGDVLIYGCVEFDRGLRCGDVAKDLALLAMDLDHRGHAAEGERLLRHSAELAGDGELRELVPFYKTHHALVRARLELAASRDDDLEEDVRRRAAREARRYAQLAVAYELPPALVLAGGPPSEARAATASYLAGRFRAARPSAGGAEGGNGRSSRTPADRSEGPLAGGERELLARAAEGLRAGRTTVVEAHFADVAGRRRFHDAAARLGAASYLVRVGEPGRGGGGSSEARDELPEHRVVEVAAGHEPEDACETLETRMLARVSRMASVGRTEGSSTP